MEKGKEEVEMRKKKSAYLKPYIRKAKAKDLRYENAASARVIGWQQACRCRCECRRRSKTYVLVQRGSNRVLIIRGSKKEVKDTLMSVNTNREFNKWCNEIKRIAQR